MSERRVVITGIGTINPLGNNVREYFDNLDKGKSGAVPIDRFDASLFKTRFACEIPSYNSDNFQEAIDRKEARKNDLFTQYAFIAAHEAIADSGLDLESENLKRIGAIVGTGVGGISTFEEELRAYTDGEPPRFSPFLIPKFISNMASGQLAIKYGLRGPNFGVSSACASSAHAIMTACDMIRTSRADVMLTGGSEAPICIASIGSFNSAKALSTNNEEYQTASRPFDKTRDGFVMGEGAGILIIEDYEHALKRGAKIYAEIAGMGITCDAYHITAPLPDGTGASDAMQIALREACISPKEVDYINVHGTSTHRGDVAELNAIKSLFSDDAYRVNISSTKSMTGHLLGAAGAIEAIACIHAMQSGIVPPTINFKVEDEEIDYRLNLTLNERQERKVDVAMSNNFGFGGQNACLVFKKI